MGGILRKFCIQRVLRPVRTLAQIFRKPKNWPMMNWVQEIIYKVTRWAVMTVHSPTFGEWSSCGAEQDPDHTNKRESACWDYGSQHPPTRHPNTRTWCQEALLRLMELNFGQRHHRISEEKPLPCCYLVYLKVNKMWGCSSSNKKLWYSIDEVWWRQTEATENQLKATDWITKKCFQNVRN